jgi:hypothetical protein
MPRLLAGLAHYAMNRKFIKPSTCRLALNRSAVVVIGVRRGGVGRDNGARRGFAYAVGSKIEGV